MSENQPPVEGRPTAPPIQAYASYPRGETTPRHGSPEKLQALMDGYYGLNWAFLALVCAGILAVAVLVVTQGEVLGVVLFLLTGLVGAIAVGFLAYKYNKKLGYGLGWQDSTAIWVTVGLVIGSCVVSPIIVFIVLQLLAMGEIKNYGVKGGFLGVRKKDIKAKIEELKQQPSVDLSAPPRQT